MPTLRGSDADIHVTDHELEIVPRATSGQASVEPHRMALADIALVEDRSASMLREGYVRVLTRVDLGAGVKDARTVHFGRDAKDEFAGLIQRLKGIATANVAARPLEEPNGSPTSIDAVMAKNEAALAQHRLKQERRRAEDDARREERRAARRR